MSGYIGSKAVFLSTTAAVVDGNITVSGSVDGVDIAARDAVLTSTTTTANAALPKSGGTMTGALTVDGAYSYLNGLRISGVDTGNTIYQPTSDLSISSASGSISLKPSGTNVLHATNTGIDVTGNVTMATGGSIVAGGANDLVLNAGESGTPDIYLQSGSSTKVKIEGSNGNVGIGTAEPARLLHLSRGGSDPQLRITGAVDWDFYSYSDNNLYINNSNGTVLSLFENRTASFASNVGIGTSSPTNGKLEVTNASSTVPTGFFRNTSGAGDSPSLTVQGGANNAAPNFSVLDYNGNTDFVVQGAGNVGIKTASPRQLLTLGTLTSFASATPDCIDLGGTYSNSAGSNLKLKLYEDGSVTHGFGVSTSSTDYVTSSTGSHKFFQSNTERMRLGSAGLLVGGTSTDPIAANTNSTQIAADGYININRASGTSLYIGRSGSDGIAVGFYKGQANVGTIYLTGSATSYNTSSDYRLKTDAQPMTGASARVQALNPVNFEWIADGSRVDGFLAHEAQEVVPESVTGTKDAMRDEEYEVTAAIEATYDDDGNELTAAVEAVMGTRSVPDMQGIDQSKIVPLLTAALQEALTEIASLKTRVAALEGN